MATAAKFMKLHALLEVTEDLGLSTTVDDSIAQVIEKALELTAGSTPDVEFVYHGTVAMSGGAATIDLTALTNAKGETIASTGKKVRAIYIVPTSTNANAITVKVGASNGYTLFGAAWSVILAADQYLLAYLGVSAPDVASGVRTIDLAGTTTQSVELLIVFG